jgi:hypothetical protein
MASNITSSHSDRLRLRYHRPECGGLFGPSRSHEERAIRPGCMGVAPGTGPPVRRAGGIAARDVPLQRGAIGRNETRDCRCGCLARSCCGWTRGRSAVHCSTNPHASSGHHYSLAPFPPLFVAELFRLRCQPPSSLPKASNSFARYSY